MSLVDESIDILCCNCHEKIEGNYFYLNCASEHYLCFTCLVEAIPFNWKVNTSDGLILDEAT